MPVVLLDLFNLPRDLQVKLGFALFEQIPVQSQPRHGRVSLSFVGVRLSGDEIVVAVD